MASNRAILAISL